MTLENIRPVVVIVDDDGIRTYFEAPAYTRYAANPDALTGLKSSAALAEELGLPYGDRAHLTSGGLDGRLDTDTWIVTGPRAREARERFDAEGWNEIDDPWKPRSRPR